LITEEKKKGIGQLRAGIMKLKKPFFAGQLPWIRMFSKHISMAKQRGSNGNYVYIWSTLNYIRWNNGNL
jgi:hypothetical protein